MGIISKIKDIIFKIKDYDRLEHDYSSVLDYATGGLLSKTNYKLDSVYDAIREHVERRDHYVVTDLWHPATELPEEGSMIAVCGYVFDEEHDLIRCGVYKQGMILHEDPYESEHWDGLADPEHKDELTWAYQKDLLPVTTLNRTK